MLMALDVCCSQYLRKRKIIALQTFIFIIIIFLFSDAAAVYAPVKLPRFLERRDASCIGISFILDSKQFK